MFTKKETWLSNIHYQVHVLRFDILFNTFEFIEFGYRYF